MMNNENMSRCLDNLYIKKNVLNKKEKKSNFVCKYFIPYQKDNLFWMFYYMKYGYLEYNLIGSNSYTTETEYKYKLIEEIKNNKKIFKDYRLQKINDCIANLSCEHETSFKTFLLLCIINNISFIYSKKKIFYSLIFEEAEEIYLLHYNNTVYGCEKTNKNYIEEYKKNKFEITYYEKPIYSINNYTLNQLIEMCNILDIPLDNKGKKMKKNELYNLLESEIAQFYNP